MGEDSPCHYCTKRPCFIHDTCPDFLKFRARIDARNAKRAQDDHFIGYICSSIAKTTRKKQRSNR